MAKVIRWFPAVLLVYAVMQIVLWWSGMQPDPSLLLWHALWIALAAFWMWMSDNWQEAARKWRELATGRR